MHNRRTTPQTVWIPGNSNDAFKLFWNGEGFVLMQCAHFTISNTYLSLLRSCGEPLESQPLGNVLFHLDWLCWWKQTIFKTFLAVCGIPWAGPVLCWIVIYDVLGSRVRRLGHKTWPCLLLIIYTWTSYLGSLSLSVFICQMGMNMRTYSTGRSWGFVNT